MKTEHGCLEFSKLVVCILGGNLSNEQQSPHKTCGDKTFCSASCLNASCQSNEDWYEGHCCRLLGQDSDNQHQSCNFCGLRTPVSDFTLNRTFDTHYTFLHCLLSCFGWHNDGKWRPTTDWYLEWGYVLCASLAPQTAAYFGASLSCHVPNGCPEYGAGSVQLLAPRTSWALPSLSLHSPATMPAGDGHF